jgi:hypothetical protein
MTVPKSSDAISVFHAALWWFDKNPEEKLTYGTYGWIVLLTRDREVRDIACAILSDLESGRMQAVRSSWLSGIPPSWMTPLGTLPGNLDPRETTVTLGTLAEFAKRRGDTPSFLAHVITDSVRDPATHSGAVGRPSSMHLVEANMRQRAQRWELATTLREETKYQSNWIREAHSLLPRVTAKAIANSLRHLFKSLRACSDARK